MSRFWSAVVGELTPYVPGEQPKIARLTKLNTNESPYPPSPRVLAAIRDELGEDGTSLRLYPDPNAEQLKQTLARLYQVAPEQVFVGNGSDEVLAHVFMGLLKHERPILFPDITYSFYPVYCGLYGVRYENVPLGEHFEVRAEDYLRDNGGIIIANPNAPTGRLLGLDAIERIVAGNPDSVVVIDEAYVDFGGESAIGLVARHANLLVVHTMSKSRSLAGLRVGYAIGQAALIEGLERIKNSFNSYPLDRLAQVGARAALEDRAWFDACRRKVMDSRDALVGRLEGLGFEVLPSAANFVFARHPRHDGERLAAALRARNILVRHFRLPRIDQFLRITIGTEEQCLALVENLNEILQQA
ncbi:MAG: histidinol-phosphate transaminase [Zoogloeaceae bacterium]|nr:histidinol-phosphate transaminase [Rhodocyclaceae bacterium]MCP5231791.1 histidinol-phosphate transaminase [Zoogloeaceae bacterium]MCP5241013.1 histidinol-phosphate transaminase [Zoogloeaceae bacterium]MCP5255638.1 histidinol-phosphate transaminase [Zoogloeaceae bacterium]MCP5294669.1 histidinol-phosphate transaminase [Zoogloeaceae bacterium]